MLSFASMTLGPFLTPHAQLWLLAISAIGFDLRVQAALIAHQSIVYAIDPSARSRLNAALMVGIFFGMATGAAMGSLLLKASGWPSVAALAAAGSFAALGVRLWPTRDLAVAHVSGLSVDSLLALETSEGPS